MPIPRGMLPQSAGDGGTRTSERQITMLTADYKQGGRYEEN